MQVLSDLQAEQFCGGRLGGALAPGRGMRAGGRLGRLFGGSGGLLTFQTIQNTVNQINFAINIVIGGGSIFNNQVNALTLQSILQPGLPPSM